MNLAFDTSKVITNEWFSMKNYSKVVLKQLYKDYYTAFAYRHLGRT